MALLPSQIEPLAAAGTAEALIAAVAALRLHARADVGDAGVPAAALAAADAAALLPWRLTHERVRVLAPGFMHAAPC